MEENIKRHIFLVPSLLSPGTKEKVIPPYILDIIKSIKYYFVEDIRTTRRFISELKTDVKIDDLIFYKVDKNSSLAEVDSFFREVKDNNVAVLSEAGCPAIADPGHLIVQYGHKSGRTVKPLVGPNSILLALMASGFNGQSFCFSGYLPIERNERIKKIKYFEKESRQKDQTQIFIETPYRNTHLLQDLITNLMPETWLCVASDLTGENESIISKKINQWRAPLPEIKNIPTVFLIYAI
ncbi:MAG: SAM-dependent methyltransferase [Cytophagaceae bacterium]